MNIQQELLPQVENVTIGLPCSLPSPDMTEEVDIVASVDRSSMKAPPKSSKVYVVNIQGPGMAKSSGSRLNFSGMSIGTVKPLNSRLLAPKPELCEEKCTISNSLLSNSNKNKVQVNEVSLLPPTVSSPSQNGPNAKGNLPNPCFTSAYANHETSSSKSLRCQELIPKSTNGLAIPSLDSPDPAGESVCTISKIFSVNVPTAIENDTPIVKGKRVITFSSVKFGNTHENGSTDNSINSALDVESIASPSPIAYVENKEPADVNGRQLELVPEQPDIMQEPFDPILVSQALIAANRKKRPNIIKPKVQKEKAKDNKIPFLIAKHDPKKNSVALDLSKLETKNQLQSLSTCLKETVASFSLKETETTPLGVDADEVTLVKINGSSNLEKEVISIPDDDVHIEIIPAKSDSTNDLSKVAKSGEIDPLQVLDWNTEGVGILPGSDFKFRMNEFGLMELVDNDDSEKVNMKKDCSESITLSNKLIESKDDAHKEVLSNGGIKNEDNEEIEIDTSKNDPEERMSFKEEEEDEEDVVFNGQDEEETAEKSEDDAKNIVDVNAAVKNETNTVDTNNEIGAIVKGEKLEHDAQPEDKLKAKEKDESLPRQASDDIFYCRGCGCYGLASEFVTPEACSTPCDVIVKEKEREELELRKLTKMRRLKRKLEKVDKGDKQDKSEKPSKIAKHVTIMKKEERTEPSDSVKSNQGWHKIQQGTTRLPWQFGSKGFSWPKYLHFFKTKAAPRKLFKSPLPYSKNNFRVGMKMEGIDPEHASLFCVLTVYDVIGYRIKLHFDGYPNKYDFWLSANSLDIFPPGWCDKTNRVLQPPKGYTQEDFNWTQYVKQTKGSPSAKTLFYNKDVPVVISGGFRIGMKLEAVDRQNTNLVCVATVADMIGTRILVHFDGWDDVYDYWAEPTSSYIHPVGWCEKYKHPLSPPNNYVGENFNWDQYLKDTKSSAAPARAFKPPLGTFRRGMRLECVDKRAPWRVRVATVDDIREHEIRIKFDGWSDLYSYWIDRDSPDIFPMSWCHTTGHFLLIPPVEKDAECPTINCTGRGHALEAEVSTRHTVPDCPYDPDNLKIKIELDDRLSSKSSEANEDEAPSRSISPEDIQPSKPKWRSLLPLTPLEKSPSPTAELKCSPGRPSKKAKLEGGSEFVNDADWLPKYEETRERRRKKKALKQAAIAKRNCMLDQVRSELHDAVMNPGYDPKPDESYPLLWSKHSAPLNTFVEAASQTDLRVWDLELVYRFVASIPGCKPHARYFIDNFIDGEALSMITQQDLVEHVGLKLGPAIKLYNSVVLLRGKVKNGVN